MADARDTRLGMEHTAVYSLRCLKCAHEWDDRTGWLPKACPKCGNVIEHGDHLSAHLKIVNIRLETVVR